MKFYVLGETGIAAQGSDNLYDLRSRENQQAVVDRIAQDIEGCARTYGRELGECCRCGRTLTSEWRQQGIGPVCASKADW